MTLETVSSQIALNMTSFGRKKYCKNNFNSKGKRKKWEKGNFL